jgi:tRNA nucleotidyltransferase/poly(A) polymerase
LRSRKITAIHHEKWERIKIIGERVVDELNKILSTDKPSEGFYCFIKNGLLDILYSELTALNQVEEIEGQTQKTILPHIEVGHWACPLMMSGCAWAAHARKSANQTI